MANILLAAYNNNSYIHYFPLSLAYVAKSLMEAGHEVKVWQQDKYHLPSSDLTEYLNKNVFNVVGIGMCAGYTQYARLKELSKAVSMANSHHDLILGGHMVSADPKYFQRLTGASKVFVGECENELKQVEDWHKKEIIKGTPTDPNERGFPAWELFDMDYYSLVRLPKAEPQDRCFPVLSGTGCPFTCNFCYRLYDGYRPRDIKHIVEEIKKLKKDYHITYIDFADELLMVSEQRAVDISQALKPLGVKWMCNGRLNYARPDVLKEMKGSGCQFINYGIESVDDEVLKNMQKALTYRIIREGVRNTLDAGISPGLNMLWGNIGDDVRTLNNALGFICEFSDWSQMRTIRLVTPYPGTPLFDEAVRRKLIKDTEDFYERKHLATELLTCNFMDIDELEIYQSIKRVNIILADRYYEAQFRSVCGATRKLYMEKDTTFKGFRPI